MGNLQLCERNFKHKYVKSICKLWDFVCRAAMLYIYGLAQGSCTVAHDYVVNKAAEGNVSVNNLVQTIVQHPAF